MDAEKIVQDLNRRFAAPLPEFYKRRIIFWYDEDQEFDDQLDDIQLDNAKLIKLTGSNLFETKKLLASDDLDSNYLVYCPITYAKPEDNWLINIELYSGEAFRADLNTIWMDEMGLPTSQMIRKQVKQYHKFFNSKERRAKVAAMAGNISTAPQLHLGVMATIYGVKELNPSAIIRTVLCDGLDAEKNARYQSMVNFGAHGAFWALVRQATGFQNSEEADFSTLAAHILLTAATRTLHKEYLQGLDKFISDAHQAWCYDFVSEWLHSVDLQKFYEIARQVEYELRLSQRFGKLEINDLVDTECFPCINELILLKLMTEIKDNIIQTDVIASTVGKRKTMVWYDAMSCYYDGLLQVSKMQSFFLDHSAGFHIANPSGIWREYTADYYRMDTYYRQFHLCFQRSLKASKALFDDLFKHVAEQVEALYSGWYLNNLGSNWSNICAEDLEQCGHIQGVPYQRDFYGSKVRSSDTRVFVIISDALRYEVAATLAEQLQRETQSDVDISSMCGIFPTITPYGMAALLPHRELTVTEKSNGGLAVLADGMSTESINRDKVLKAAASNSVALQYKNIIGLKRDERKALVKGMDVVYIYHDRIDEAAHTSDGGVFPACDEAMEEIKNLVRIIANEFGGTQIYITADHGFLYTYSPLTEDSKVSKSSWAGQEVEYGRRYAIMKKGSNPDYLMPVQYLNGKTDYEAYAPRDNVRIKMMGGGLNYVHGGISLQEMVVPVISYHFLRNDNKTYQRNRAKFDTKPVSVGLLSSNHKVSNMIFSLNFYQKEPVGGNRESAIYEVYFTDASGKVISDTSKIIADRTGTNSEDRTFRCNFNLKSLSFDNKETYYLVIADQTGLQMPQREEFQIDIAFAVEEFNFF